MPRGINPFPPQGPPSAEEVQDVTAGRSPTGIGGLTLKGVADFAQRAGGAGIGAMQSGLQGLRNPQPSGGLVSQGLGLLGSLGRRLPGAYAAGQGQMGQSQVMMNQVAGQEQQAAMNQALAGLDPTNPADLPQIAQIAQSYGDTGTALKIMEMIQSGEMARLKAEQTAPKMRQIRDGDDVVHEQWDPMGRRWIEVGRGPVSKGATVNVNTGEVKSTIYDDVMAETGDPWMAKAATENKAFRDPSSGFWASGGEAEYGKAREFQGYAESLAAFLRVTEEMEAAGIDTSLVGEGMEATKAFLGEGDPLYRRFVQARQELLTQYVKARSGAQVSDKEIGRYEAQFPKYRDMFEGGQLKPGARAMIEGMIVNGTSMARSRIPHKNKDAAEKIFHERLGVATLGVAPDMTAERLWQEWETGREGKAPARADAPEHVSSVQERLDAAGITDNESPEGLAIIDAYLEENGLRQ